VTEMAKLCTEPNTSEPQHLKFAIILGDCFSCKQPVLEGEGSIINNTAAGTSLVTHSRGKCYPRITIGIER
jgi:hypothetical protein